MYNFWLFFVTITVFLISSSTVKFVLLHLCFGEWSQKSSPNFFPFKKEISCWAFLSYSCQNWGCGLFNLCTWSLLISWKICKMLFLSNLWGNNLKKVKLFLNLCQRCWDICKCFEKKLGKKGWRWWRTECLKWRGSVTKNFNQNTKT